MADKTKIEWTRGRDGRAGATWNPIIGCTRVSAGCQHCYAEPNAWRMAHPAADQRPAGRYHGLVTWYGAERGEPRWNGTVRLVAEVLDHPLRWRAPRRIFANSMGDLWHPDVPWPWLDRVFAVMAASPQHEFLTLTKRAAELRAYLTDPATPGRIAAAREQLTLAMLRLEPTPAPVAAVAPFVRWPLANVWLGVSAEHQAAACERAPLLLECPAALYWLSAEPLLEALDVRDWLLPGGLDWVVSGGESGRGARLCRLDWHRGLRDQCRARGVAYYLKQLGANPVENGRLYQIGDPKGGDPGRWPLDLRIREYPNG